MPAELRVVRLPVADVGDSFDVQELANEAAVSLESYRRAPWLQMNERARMSKLQRAIELLQRIDNLEKGQIPMPIWGD